MKKSLLILFAIITTITLNTQAEDFSAIYNGKTIYYNITSSTYPRTVEVTFRGASSSTFPNAYSGAVSIPDSVLYSGNYYNVTSIGASAFSGCSGLTSITIGNSVTSIGVSAFSGCSGLTSITIPNSVTSIGNNAFKSCTGLTSITIPNSVTSIGSRAFEGCTSLTSITIPNSVTSIGDRAFYNCSGLTSITIPNSVTSIGNSAFSYCSGLTSITIPNSVISIGESAFSYCSGLTSITIPNSVTSIGSSAFYNTPYYNNKPDGLVYINNVLYKYKGTMPANTSINVLSGTISISDYAFSNCTGLTSITIGNSVTSIGNSAFWNCYGLTSITIGNSVTSIGNSAFWNCNGLTSITIPNSVTSIGSGAFDGCSGLTSITIGNSVTSIGEYAFGNCSGLTSITIPNSVNSIGYDAFKNCTSLDTMYFNAFYCNSIGDATRTAFDGCYNFRTLVIGDSVQNVPSKAFFNCSSLTSIISRATNPPIVQGNSYYGVSKTIPFYTPCNSIPSYQSALYWSDFTNYVGIRTPQFINTSICDGSIYTDYGANIDSAGVYTLVNGCDSVILNLSIKPTFQTDYYDTICKGQNYNNYGFSFVADTSGQYRRSLQAVNGCDSIIVLNLFVNPALAIPTDLNVQVTANYIEFTWQSNGSSYAIYRNDSLIANVTQPIYLDYNVVNGQSYCYKVKAIKGDCESEFSNIVCKSFLGLSDISSNTIQTKIYPNPTNNKSKLEFEGLTTEADVLVYDMVGRVIQKHRINQGNKVLDIDLSGYAKGVYSVRIINDRINQTKKLIVQ
ncbi:MAG: leucine-rich repeat domain-containing protein [Bacteroidales bacterium]|nr:leucine-rich repeat domain-containing protein [Bacteroidales bacterium]